MTRAPWLAVGLSFVMVLSTVPAATAEAPAPARAWAGERRVTLDQGMGPEELALALRSMDLQILGLVSSQNAGDVPEEVKALLSPVWFSGDGLLIAQFLAEHAGPDGFRFDGPNPEADEAMAYHFVSALQAWLETRAQFEEMFFSLSEAHAQEPLVLEPEGPAEAEAAPEPAPEGPGALDTPDDPMPHPHPGGSHGCITQDRPKPTMTKFESELKSYFVIGESVPNKFTASATISPGTDCPGKDDVKEIRVTLAGQTKTIGGSSGSVDFDMGQLKAGPNTAKAVAISDSGASSEPMTLQFFGVKKPEWVDTVFKLFGWALKKAAPIASYEVKIKFEKELVRKKIPDEFLGFDIPFGGFVIFKFKAEGGFKITSKPEVEMSAKGEFSGECCKSLSGKKAGGGVSVSLSGTFSVSDTIKITKLEVTIGGSLSIPVPAWYGQFKLPILGRFSLKFGFTILVSLDVSFTLEETKDPTKELFWGLGWKSLGKTTFGLGGEGWVNGKGKSAVGTLFKGEAELSGSAKLVGKCTLILRLPFPCEPLEIKLGVSATVTFKVKVWKFEVERSFGYEKDIVKWSSTKGFEFFPDFIQANATWKPNPRLYDTPDYNRFVASGDAGKAVDNAFPGPGPLLAVSGPKTMLVWMHDDVARPVEQGITFLYAALENGTWSAPKSVLDNDLAELEADLVGLGNGNFMLVYTSLSQPIGDASTTEPASVVNQTEVYAVQFKDDAWGEPARLTNDTSDDLAVRAAAGPGGRVMATWIQDADADPETDDLSIWWSQWNGLSWSAGLSTSAAAVGEVNVTAPPSFAYSTAADQLAIGGLLAWVEDADSLNGVLSDAEVFAAPFAGAAFGQKVRVTDDGVQDIEVALVPGKDAGVELVYSTYRAAADAAVTGLQGRLWQPGQGFGEVSSVVAGAAVDGLRAVRAGSDLVAVWHDSVEGAGQVAMAHLDLDSRDWGPGRVLTATDQATFVSAPIPALLGGEVRAAVQVGPFASEADQDVLLLDATLRPDLEVLSLALDPANPAPGSTASYTAEIGNVGDRAAEDVDVEVRANDDAFDTVSIEALEAGGTATVTGMWSVPTQGAPFRVEAVADPADEVRELREDNNRLAVRAALPDVGIELFSQDPDMKLGMLASLANEGSVAAPSGSFELRLADGTVLGSAALPGLGPGATAVVHVAADPALTPPGENLVWGVAVLPAEELRLDNNADEAILTAGADLVVASFSAPAGPLHLSQLIAVSGTVRNDGAFASPATTVAVLQSVEGPLLGSAAIPALAPGASAGFTTSVLAQAEGVHLLTAHVDPDGLLPEADEANNYAQRTVVVASDGTWDLVVLPGSVRVGDAFIEALVLNAGTASAPDVEVRALSQNVGLAITETSLGPGELKLVRIAMDTGLWAFASNPGFDVQVWVDAPVPGLPNGLYPETNETNNWAFGPPVIVASTHDDPNFRYWDNAPSFTLRAPNGVRAPLGYSWALDNTPDTLPDTVVDGASGPSFSGLGTGTWWFHVRATDGGSWSGAAHRSFMVDRTDNLVPVTALALGNPRLDGPPVVVHPGTPFSLAALDPQEAPDKQASGVEARKYAIDGGAVQTFAGPFALGGLPDGSHTVEYWASDRAGNVEARQALGVLLDGTPPDTSITSHAHNQTVVATQTFVARATDNIAGVQRAEFWLNGQLRNTQVAEGPEFSWTTDTKEWVVGKNVVTVRAYDKLGNVRDTPLRVYVPVAKNFVVHKDPMANLDQYMPPLPPKV